MEMAIKIDTGFIIIITNSEHCRKWVCGSSRSRIREGGGVVVVKTDD